MAHQEGLRYGNSEALTAHTGTAGTSEMVRVVATSAGALSVDLVSSDTIAVTVGTIASLAKGTISAGTVDLMKAGTITKVEGGSIAVTAATVTAGTINAGTITAGTVDLMKAGTITKVEGGSIVVTAGTFTGDWTTYQGTVQIPTSDTVTSGTLNSTIDGLVRGITVQTPDMTGTNQTTFRLLDGLGGTIIGLAAQAESAITFYGTIQPVTTSMKWTATSAGTESAAKDIIFQVHYEK